MKKILTADPDALAASVVPKAAEENKDFMLPNMTVRDLIERAEDVMQHGPGKWRPSR